MGRYCATRRKGSSVPAADIDPVVPVVVLTYDAPDGYLDFTLSEEHQCTVILVDTDNPGEPIESVTDTYPAGPNVVSYTTGQMVVGHSYQATVQATGHAVHYSNIVDLE